MLEVEVMDLGNLEDVERAFIELQNEMKGLSKEKLKENAAFIPGATRIIKCLRDTADLIENLIAESQR